MKSNIKRLFLLLFITITAVLCFAFSANALQNGKYTYEVKNSTAVITEVDSSVSGNITIPEKLGKYKVTEIAPDAFYDCYKLTSVTIPSTITKLGIEDTKNGYYYSAFCGCDRIKNFKVSADNKNYSSDKYGVLFNKEKTVLYSFPASASIATYTVPNSVKKIMPGAFDFSSGDGFLNKSGKKLTKIVIGKNVKLIDDTSFYGCCSLKKFEISEANKYYSNDNFGVLYNKNKTKLIKYPEGLTETAFVIPDSVKEISGCAFSRNTQLKNLYLPKSITSIENIFFDPYVDSTIKNIYFSGTEKQWKALNKGEFDTDFIYSNVKIIFNSKAPVYNIKSTSKVTSNSTINSIKLSWSKVTGASGYRIYVKKSGKWVKLADTTKLTYTVKKLNSGSTYKYAIKAYSKLGSEKIWATKYKEIETSTKPATSTLKVTSPSKGKATLTWSNPSGESGFEVYYSTKNNSGFKKVITTKSNVKKATINKLTSNKTYYFKVRSFKTTSSGKAYSAFSSVKSIKIK